MTRLYVYNIVAVTETWAHTGINDAELSICGFDMYRMNCKANSGRGVLVYVRETLKSCTDSKLMSEEFEDSV